MVKNWTRSAGTKWSRSTDFVTLCRHGRSSRSGARPLPPRRSRNENDPVQRRAGEISPSRATGRTPACPLALKGRSAQGTAPRNWPWAAAMYNEDLREGNPLVSANLLHSVADIEGGDPIAAAIDAATAALPKLQRDDGHWVFELEADATIPAEYVLLVHYLAETPNLELERKIGVYLRRIRGRHGGWPLFHDGAFDISATVKAYFALKMIGDSPDAPHIVQSRESS